MIKTTITSGDGQNNIAEVLDSGAVSVATRPYYTFEPRIQFFTNPIHNVEMNKNWSNVGAGNSNEGIHNGTDTAEWTGSVVAGTGWTMANTNNPATGAKNISAISASLGSEIQANRGSNVTMSAHTGFQMSVDVTSMGHVSAAQLEFYAYNTASGVVGNTVNIYDYTGGITVGYVTFTIPLADMGLTSATFDAVRFRVAGRTGAIVDIDDIILLDPTGSVAEGAQTFEIVPPRGKQIEINSFVITMADVYAGTIANGTMPSLPYDGFLAVAKLTNGMLFRVINKLDNVTFTANFTQLMDMMQFGINEFAGMGSDGVNSWFSLRVGVHEPIILNDSEKDKIEITLSDDLSGLLWFRWSANVGERDIL